MGVFQDNSSRVCCLCHCLEQPQVSQLILRKHECSDGPKCGLVLKGKRPCDPTLVDRKEKGTQANRSDMFGFAKITNTSLSRVRFRRFGLFLKVYDFYCMHQ